MHHMKASRPKARQAATKLPAPAPPPSEHPIWDACYARHRDQLLAVGVAAFEPGVTTDDDHPASRGL